MKKQFNYDGHIITIENGMYSTTIGPKQYYGNRLDGAINFIENNPK